MYAIYHGKKGITEIAQNIYKLTSMFHSWCLVNGLEVVNENCFDTVTFKHKDADWIQDELYNNKILVFRDNDTLSITFDESSTVDDKTTIIRVISKRLEDDKQDLNNTQVDSSIHYRNSDFLTEDLFKGMDELELTRYIHKLADKDYSLVNGMIPQDHVQ